MITRAKLEKAKIEKDSLLEVTLMNGFELNLRKGETVKLSAPSDCKNTVSGYLTKISDSYMQLSASPDGKIDRGLGRSCKVYYSMVKSFKEKSELEF